MPNSGSESHSPFRRSISAFFFASIVAQSGATASAHSRRSGLPTHLRVLTRQALLEAQQLGAVMGQADWIAVSVAVASQCMALIDYFYIPAQLAATNKALENAHNLLSYWDSLSLVQRKMRSSKQQCAANGEAASLKPIAAKTGASAPSGGGGGGGDDEE